MYVAESIAFALKNSFKWSNIKFALLNGFFVTVFWGFIGYFIWDYLIAVASSFVEIFPFSMIRADGAWIVSSLIFFQVILVTFAILMAFFGEFFLKKNKEQYTLYTIATFIVSALFWAMVWFFKGSILYNEILKILMWFPFQTIEKAIAFFVAFYIIYNAIIVTILMTTSIFSPKIIRNSFESSEMNTKHKFASILYTLRDGFIFFIASLALFFVLFIPVVNIIVQILLWVWLIRDTVTADALYLNFGELRKDIKKSHRKATFAISFVASLFNFLPIIYFFASVFAELAMFYYFKSVKEHE